MFNRSITSIAILKANWDVRHSDYIDNFVPFFLNLIKIKKYDEIDQSVLSKDFNKEYGLSIPYHPLKTILTRLKNRGVIIKKDYKYLVDRSKIDGDNFEDVSVEQQRKLSKLTHSLVDFCKTKHNVEITETDAEEALLSFFRENELGILFATKEESLIPDIQVSKTNKYLVAKFIQFAKDSEPELFRFLTDIAVGTALATAIVYGEDLTKFSGRNKGMNLYLDTGYLLILLGINGEEKEQAFAELTRTLIKDGANLFVFEHTYDEVMQILNSALYWLDNGNYDVKKASRSLRYFLARDFRATQVESFIAQIPATLDKYKIQKTSKPSYSKDIEYQIGESELKDLIVTSYKNDPYFDETEKNETINKDIDSIYSICKLRKGRIAYTLKDASYIFITTNLSLARISREVQSDDNAPFAIPPCITDTLIGTLVWLQNPIKTTVINEKKLIADAYAAVQPDTPLLKRYLQELDSLKKESRISDDEYFILRTHRIAFNLLSEKTKNDSHNFESKTSLEILDEINKTHLFEIRKELENESKLNAEKTRELDEKERILKETKKNSEIIAGKYERIINRIAQFLTWFLFLPAISAVIYFLLINYFLDVYLPGFTTRIIASLVLIAVTIFGLDFFKVKKWLFEVLKDFLIEKIF